jgi:DNA-binding transcriptional MerR regulator
VYSISAVARMLGIPVATIRTWEDRYGLVVPERNASGHRLYRRDQVEQLKFVRASIADGVSTADAHRLLAERTDGEPAAAPNSESGARLLILLADHDPYAAEYQEYFLKTEGFGVDVALTAAAARASFGAHPPAVVVVDLLLSGGAGLDLCRFIKQHGDVLVIVVSALAARDQAAAAGADAFLLKPLEPLQLVSTVRDLLGSSAMLRPVAGQA